MVGLLSALRYVFSALNAAGGCKVSVVVVDVARLPEKFGCPGIF